MPLGFGRSILSRYEAPAAGGGGTYYYTDETSRTSADQAGYVLTAGSSPFAASTEISVVYWYRTNNGDDYSKVFHGQTTVSPTPGRWYASFVGPSRIELHTFQGGNAMTALFNGPLTSGVRQEVFDGAWHCIMLYKNAAATSGSSIGNDFYAVWDDRVATNGGGSQTTSTAQATDYSVYNSSPDTMADIETLCFGFRDYTQLNPTNMTNGDQFSGASFDFGPIWIYDKKIDFSSSTVRGYYYDSTATDGFVDGGTDGTAGGAEQPAIYMYHDGTDWKNGGTKFNSTATKVTKGSGDITVTNTDGPGTGGTT